VSRLLYRTLVSRGLVRNLRVAPLLIVAGALISSLAATAAAGERCTGVENASAGLFADSTWATLRSWRIAFSACENCALGKLVSEYVTVRLAQRWEVLADLEHDIEKDPQFRDFVLRHIDVTSDPEDLNAIVRNATQRCPEKSAALCGAIAQAARSALAEMCRSPREPVVGDLYSVTNSDCTYGVWRVLATREHDFYVRIYGNRFATRPTQLELSQLTPDLGRSGFTHVSIVRRYFGNSKPCFANNVGPPTGEDLAFSQMWARETSPPADTP